MSNFFDMVFFEYKKILKRRITFISFLILIAIMLTFCFASVTSQNYANKFGGVSSFTALKLDRETIRSNKGYIEADIIKEAIRQNEIMIADDNNFLTNEYGSFLKGDAYIKYSLPYENINKIINVVYTDSLRDLATADGLAVLNPQPYNPIDTLSEKDAEVFYDKIKYAQKYFITNNNFLRDNEKVKLLGDIDKISTPFYNDYFGGYSNFLYFSSYFSMALIVVIIVCISPIFAEEYTEKTDHLILSAKHGKNKIIFAKFFTGVSFSLILAAFSLLIFLLLFLSIHGFSGGNVPIQLLGILTPYNLTFLQAITVYCVTISLTCLLFSAFVMFLSSICKSPFPVSIISLLFLFIPVFIIFPHKYHTLYRLSILLPVKTVFANNLFDSLIYNFFGVLMEPYIFIPVFSVVFSIFFIPFIFNGFKNHQIN